MERMLIKHRSGSKANQVEEFSLKHHDELVFGRDLTATVKYDPDRDDLVGRQHARISRDPVDPSVFLLTDLSSTNGTFLNGEKVSRQVRVNPGDRVQFGPGGPEFVFDIEPRPTEQMKTTRAFDPAAAPTIPSTRAVSMGTGSSDVRPAGTVGKATVERMVSQAVEDTKRAQGRKFGAVAGVLVVLVLVLVVGAVGGGYWYFNTVSGRTSELEKKTAGISPSEINDKYSKAVVQIDVTWRLMNKAEQSQVYHAWTYPDTGGSPVPLYVKLKSGKVEPVLRYKKELDADKQISGTVTGTGFIVTPNGFVLTSRNVAAPWTSTYRFDRRVYPNGILLSEDYATVLSKNEPPPDDWVPANSEQVRERSVTVGNKKKKIPLEVLTANLLLGKEDLIEVTQPGKDTPIRGQLMQVSPRHNVAQIKINVTGDLPKVETFDSYETLRKGDLVTIIGYTDASPPQYGVFQDRSSSEMKMRVIPDPKVVTSNVSDIRRDIESKGERRVSVMGDYFELATGTAVGASGAPIFDVQGRVIGIFVPGDDPNVFFGVPIRYAKFGGS